MENKLNDVLNVTILPKDFDSNFLIIRDIFGHPAQFARADDCPLARAIRREFGVRSAVGITTARIGNKYYEIMGTFSAQRAIGVFSSQAPYPIKLKEVHFLSY